MRRPSLVISLDRLSRRKENSTGSRRPSPPTGIHYLLRKGRAAHLIHFEDLVMRCALKAARELRSAREAKILEAAYGRAAAGPN